MTGRAPLPVGRNGRRARRRHIETLTRRVRAGTYRVPAGAVADAVIETVLTEVAAEVIDGTLSLEEADVMPPPERLGITPG